MIKLASHSFFSDLSLFYPYLMIAKMMMTMVASVVECSCLSSKMQGSGSLSRCILPPLRNSEVDLDNYDGNDTDDDDDDCDDDVEKLIPRGWRVSPPWDHSTQLWLYHWLYLPNTPSWWWSWWSWWYCWSQLCYHHHSSSALSRKPYGHRLLLDFSPMAQSLLTPYWVSPIILRWTFSAQSVISIPISVAVPIYQSTALEILESFCHFR